MGTHKWDHPLSSGFFWLTLGFIKPDRTKLWSTSGESCLVFVGLIFSWPNGRTGSGWKHCDPVPALPVAGRQVLEFLNLIETALSELSPGEYRIFILSSSHSDRIVLEPRIEIPCILQGFWTGSFTYVCLNSYNEHMLKTNSNSVKGNTEKSTFLSHLDRPLSPCSKTAGPVHTALQQSPACVCH